jgi:nucleoside-diphosphate-sugar epimerase
MQASAAKRVVVTGGSGKAGKWVVRDLVEHGYSVLNLDLRAGADLPAPTLVTDVTDAGQVYNALAGSFAMPEFRTYLRPQPVDAIVHLAAIPRLLYVPDNEVFRINVLGTYNVLDAASKLAIPKVIIASSEAIYGLVFAHGQPTPDYLPLDEEYPLHPMDSYALSKLCNEATARAFHARGGLEIVALRIGNVIEPADYPALIASFSDPAERKYIAWSYIDARDLAMACRLAINTDDLGFQVLNVTADDVSSNLPTAELLRRFYPDVRLTRTIGERETLLSNDRAKQVLGFRPQHAWMHEAR